MCKSVNKFTDNDLIEKVVGYDIFCLHETHCDLDQWLELHEFSRSVHLIRFKLKQTGKIYVRNSVRPGKKFSNHVSDDFIWLKLRKDLFGLHEDI
jgi:hypothetical protein